MGHDELVPVRAGRGVPRCHLAIEGDDVFLAFDGLLDPEAEPLVACLGGSPKELLAKHAVFDAPGALVVRRSRVEPILAPHVLGEPAPHGELELARVAEFPSLLVATRALVRRWTKLRAPVVAIRPPHAHLRPMPLFAADPRAPE